MIEKEIEVKTILIKRYCDCGGEMLPNGGVLCTYPAKYSHTCNKCGNIESYWESYPKVEYKEVE
jgi:hypothetical protein